MQVLTPTGYVDLETLRPGAELRAFDTNTGAPIVNILESYDWVTESYEQDATPRPVTTVVINGLYLVPSDESIWRNATEVVHGSELVIGDVVYNDADGDVLVVSLQTIAIEGWWRLRVSGDHSFIADGITLHNASRYWVGGNASTNWNVTGPTNWGSASNTRDGASVPVSTDAVIFDGVGFGASNCTHNLAATLTTSANFTGYTGTFTHNTGTNFQISGSLTLSPSMTYSWSGTAQLTLSASSTGTWTTYSIPLPRVVLGTGGTTLRFTLGSDIVVSGGSISRGTVGGPLIFNAAGYSITATGLSLLATTAGSTVSIADVTVSGTGTVFTVPTGATVTHTGTITITDTSSTAKTFAGQGKTYNNLTVTGDNVTITGANSFATLANNTAGLPTGLVLTSAITQTVSDYTTNSTSGSPAKLSASVAGSRATISKASGVVSVLNASITDSAASGGAVWNAINCSNGGNNTGWNFGTGAGPLLSPGRNSLVRV